MTHHVPNETRFETFRRSNLDPIVIPSFGDVHRSYNARNHKEDTSIGELISRALSKKLSGDNRIKQWGIVTYRLPNPKTIFLESISAPSKNRSGENSEGSLYRLVSRDIALVNPRLGNKNDCRKYGPVPNIGNNHGIRWNVIPFVGIRLECMMRDGCIKVSYSQPNGSGE